MPTYTGTYTPQFTVRYVAKMKNVDGRWEITDAFRKIVTPKELYSALFEVA